MQKKKLRQLNKKIEMEKEKSVKSNTNSHWTLTGGGSNAKLILTDSTTSKIYIY